MAYEAAHLKQLGRFSRAVISLCLSAVIGVACGSSDRPEGWTEATHGKDTPPNYDLLFSTSQVHKIEMVIDPARFQEMQSDLAALVAEAEAADNTSVGPNNPPPTIPPEAIAACAGLTVDDSCSMTIQGQAMTGTCFDPGGGQLACKPAGGPPDGGGGGGGAINKFSRDPVYVPVTVSHEGYTWWHVGMRYKGNASLLHSYQDGNGKLSFRFDFEQFEDTYPKIEDQRFYGFQKLTFSSNYLDDSQIRECFTDEVFRNRGVPAARCAFYRIYVDVGQGSEYWGLYSMVEDPADGAMLDSQFGGRGGNLYKPENTCADWTCFDQTGFAKKTNEDAADWSDVEGAIAALHADASDPATWRAGLEHFFDASLFLSWLAVNTVIVNWDSYGVGPHNYYLYGDPAASGQLKWIPWDHNLAMMDMSRQPGHDDASAPTQAEIAAEIFHTDVGAEWPLISKLLADPDYAVRYRQEVELAVGGLFSPEQGEARMRELHDLVAPAVVGPDGERPGYTTISSEAAFLDSIDGAAGLKAHLLRRNETVRLALESQ